MIDLPSPSATLYQWRDEKIEYFVQSESAKNRLRDDLVPMESSKTNKRRITRSFIFNIVDQFAKEINNKKRFFEKSSFIDLVLPFAKSIAFILEYAPGKVSIQATSTPSIYIFAEIDHVNLHIDLIFNEVTGKFEEAVANIFSEKVQKLNVFGSIDEVSLAIQQYLKPQSISKYEQYTPFHYGISGQTYSPLGV